MQVRPALARAAAFGALVIASVVVLADTAEAAPGKGKGNGPSAGSSSAGRGGGGGVAPGNSANTPAAALGRGTGGGTGPPSSSFDPFDPNSSVFGNGANASGPYDATGQQGPGPGRGGGQATGRPCDGCVGNADDKNPPGQLPGPQDRNRGYECEAGPNFGVGQGNPAHSGCGRALPPEPPPPPGGGGGGGGGGGFVLTVADAPVVKAAVSPAAPRITSPTLPVTGTNVPDVLGLGLLLTTMGVVLTRASHRRPRRC